MRVELTTAEQEKALDDAIEAKQMAVETIARVLRREYFKYAQPENNNPTAELADSWMFVALAAMKLGAYPS